jgi:outer membrane biosynthesis protein TonB
MMADFELQKNVRAGGYTATVVGLLLLLLFLVKWSMPIVPPPPIEEGIEVNLGNSDQGLGDNQPMSPEKAAPANQPKYSPPKVTAVAAENTKEVETDDREKDAPVVKKPSVSTPKATKIPVKDEAVKPKPTPAAPVSNPVPAPPKPKAVFKGVSGTGKGGNEAETYKKGGNQGVAGGNGDQGKPGGDPNSTNYEGNGGSGNSGVRISRGLSGRNIVRFPSFEDDFNENAKVAVDIKVDASGKVSSAVFQPRGSTTSNPALKAIAIKKAMQLKLNASGEDEQMGTITFNFRLKN